MKRIMMGLSRVMALLGGLVLTTLIVLTCVSIAGRLLNGFFHGSLMQGVFPGFADWAIGIGIGPITGDFELVEAGVAFAIFAFMPLCQITGSHASVDIFSNMLPRGVNRVLSVVIDAIFAAVLVLIAVQLSKGMESKMSYGETSFLLQFPVWWAYAASLVGATVAAIVGIYVALVRLIEAVTGRSILSDDLEAGV